MNTPGPEARLRHGEPAALLAEQIARRHPHIAEHDLTVPLRRQVI